jgi:hypothetical protein
MIGTVSPEAVMPSTSVVVICRSCCSSRRRRAPHSARSGHTYGRSMPSPTARPVAARVSAWITAHERVVAAGVLTVAAVLVMIAISLAVALRQEGPPKAAAPTTSASKGPIETAEGTIAAASGTPMATGPASPSATPGEEHRLAEGWVEVASFGADDSIDAVHDVVRAPFGILAAGVHVERRDLPVFGPLPQQGQVWLSSNGRSWEDVTPSDGAFADASIYDLVALADGAVVAFSHTEGPVEGAPGETFAAWLTNDGRSWTRAEITVGGSPVHDVVNGGAGYLAARGLADGSAELWHSSDGRSFEPVLALPSGRVIASMGAGPEGFVVISRSIEGTASSIVHASGDGVDWYEATPPVDDAAGIASIGSDWIGTGWGQFTDPAASEASSWFSADGLEWIEAGPIPLGALELAENTTCRELAAAPVSTGRLVVVPSSLSYPCAEGHVQSYGAAHVTADGTTWVKLPFTGPTSPGERKTRGATVSAGVDLENGTLVAGESAYRATFWFRPND